MLALCSRVRFIYKHCPRLIITKYVEICKTVCACLCACYALYSMMVDAPFKQFILVKLSPHCKSNGHWANRHIVSSIHQVLWEANNQDTLAKQIQFQFKLVFVVLLTLLSRRITSFHVIPSLCKGRWAYISYSNILLVPQGQPGPQNTPCKCCIYLLHTAENHEGSGGIGNNFPLPRTEKINHTCDCLKYALT